MEVVSKFMQLHLVIFFPTPVVKPDNRFEVYLDQNLINSGSLLTDVRYLKLYAC